MHCNTKYNVTNVKFDQKKSFDDSTRYDLTIHETILEIANYIDKEQIDFTCSAIFLEVISDVVGISLEVFTVRDISSSFIAFVFQIEVAMF